MFIIYFKQILPFLPTVTSTAQNRDIRTMVQEMSTMSSEPLERELQLPRSVFLVVWGDWFLRENELFRVEAAPCRIDVAGGKAR